MSPIAKVLIIVAALLLLGVASYLLVKGYKRVATTGGDLLFMGPNNATRADLAERQLVGNASISNSWLELTEDAPSKVGSVNWAIFPGTSWSLSFTYQNHKTTPGDRADDTWVSVYRASTDITRSDTDDGAKTGYTIGFADLSGAVTLRYINDTLAVSGGNVFADETNHQFRIDCRNGAFLVYIDGKGVLGYTDPLFALRPEVKGQMAGVAIGSWCGGASAQHAIQNIVMTAL